MYGCAEVGLVTQPITHAHGQASASYVHVHSLDVVGHTRHSGRVELEVGIAGRRVLAVVLETVQVLVALAADLAAVWLLFLHADSSGVRNRGGRVDY